MVRKSEDKVVTFPPMGVATLSVPDLCPSVHYVFETFSTLGVLARFLTRVADEAYR